MHPAMLLMFPFLFICMMVHPDPVIGMFIIIKWGLIGFGAIALLLSPWIIYGLVTHKERAAEAKRKYDEELRKRYPGLKSFSELLKEMETKKTLADFGWDANGSYIEPENDLTNTNNKDYNNDGSHLIGHNHD